MKKLRNFINERMTDILDGSRLFKKYPAYISVHILKQSIRSNKVIDEFELYGDDTIITNNRFYWFFADIEEAEDAWHKMQRICQQKAETGIDGKYTINCSDVELEYKVK